MFFMQRDERNRADFCDVGKRSRVSILLLVIMSWDLVCKWTYRSLREGSERSKRD